MPKKIQAGYDKPIELETKKNRIEFTHECCDCGLRHDVSIFHSLKDKVMRLRFKRL